jgi:putative restriction endonuclease
MEQNKLLHVKNKFGTEIDAHFSIEQKDDGITVVIESKGGGINSRYKRNGDYDVGFQLLLERLALKGAIIYDAVVDSQTTQHANLSREKRRLQLFGYYVYPIVLSGISDFEKLRTALCKAQKPIGQELGAKGGNGQKRIRLYVRPEHGAFDQNSLGRDLADPKPSAVFTESDLIDAADEANQDGGFDPCNIEDARSRALAAIVQRQGQPRFRGELLGAYGGACAITKCNLEEVLEAAHIYPFKGHLTNTVQNGLLLRADIHTLFDRGLIAIDTSDWTILVDRKLSQTEYGALNGQPLSLPAQNQFRPNKNALDFHKEFSNIRPSHRAVTR